MFGKIGAGELILILGIVLLVFGPKKLPELGKSLGISVGQFKKFSNGVKEEINEIKGDIEIPLDKKIVGKNESN